MDVNEDKDGITRDEAAAAFLKSWEDPEEVSKDKKGAKVEDDETIIKAEEEEVAEDLEELESEEDPSETEETEEDEDAEDKPAAKQAEDDAEVTFSVDGVEHKVSVKDLKRLAGQEAALTRKSQEVAAEKKAVEDVKSLHHTALNALVAKAEERYKPFAQIDFLVASKEMSSEDFAAVRAEATAAYNDLQFLSQELGTFNQKQQAEKLASWNESAQDCIKVLMDPEKGIKGWTQKVYDDVRNYATKSGMNPDVVNNITDPAAIKMIYKSMAYDNIKKVATKKKVGGVKNPVKSTSNVSTAKINPSAKSAMAVLKATGTRESAANAFLAGWKEAD